jgi:ribonuclease HI
MPRERILPGRLFAEPKIERPADLYTANVDGASRGNPGPAAYAVIVRRPDGSAVYQLGKYLGRATNNVAEYFALIGALDYCAEHNISRLRVRSDSELLVRQMEGRYKVKSESLKPLHERALRQARSFAYFAVEHIPRELNSDADALANAALDRTGEVRKEDRNEESNEARHEQTTEVRATDSPRRATSRPQIAPHTVTARYKSGALHPSEPLDIPEGAEVQITIHPITKK